MQIRSAHPTEQVSIKVIMVSVIKLAKTITAKRVLLQNIYSKFEMQAKIIWSRLLVSRDFKDNPARRMEIAG